MVDSRRDAIFTYFRKRGVTDTLAVATVASTVYSQWMVEIVILSSGANNNNNGADSGNVVDGNFIINGQHLAIETSTTCSGGGYCNSVGLIDVSKNCCRDSNDSSDNDEHSSREGSVTKKR